MHSLTSLGWNPQLQNEHSEHAAALTPARVVAVDRDSYLVATDAADPQAQRRVTLAGRLRHQPGSSVAVGDWVGLEESRIDYVFARRSSLKRKRPGHSSDEQVIAANVDWTLVAMSLNDDFSTRRAERFVIAAWDAGTTPVIVLTKSDLVPSAASAIDSLMDVAAGTEIVALSSLTGDGVDELRARIGAGQTAVLVGSSGVGKSSLINAMLEREQQATAPIRESDAKGRHKTSRRELLMIPATGGLIIDTPGMREFGVVGSDDGIGLGQGFAEIEELADECSFRDCRHESEPGCAIREAIERGDLRRDRLTSYRKLQRELAYNERRNDAAKEREEARRWKRISIQYRQRTKLSPKR